MWWLRDSRGRVEFGFTNRHGGVSAGAFAELNLALHTGDEPAAVESNRSRVASDLGASNLVFMHQVHGTAVQHISSLDAPMADADILLTTITDVPIGVLVADCVPLIMIGADVIAVVHAGRVGLLNGVVETAVEALHEVSGHLTEVILGPRVCGACYEVPAEMAAEFSERYSNARVTTQRGTPGLDIGAAARQAVEGLGVFVTDPAVSVCTLGDNQFFSHRRAGPYTGRCAAVAVLR